MTKSISRLAALALIVLATIFSGSSAALADPESEPTPSITALSDDHEPSEKPEPSQNPEFDDDDRHHSEIHDQYGNDVDQVFLPPLVVKPGSAPVAVSDKHSGTTHLDPSTSLNGRPLVPLKSANEVNPAANIPVDLELVSVTDQTPADQFFQAATFGLGLMSVGAVGLGAVAVTQRIRHRRDNNSL